MTDILRNGRVGRKMWRSRIWKSEDIPHKRLSAPCGISSSAVDLVARRGVFSRRHYGSVEHLGAREQQDGFKSGRFRVEDGDRDEISNVSTGTDIHLENPEFQTRWYFKYFLGKIHQNYVGCDVEKNAYFLSVVLTDANNHNVPQYRAILWRKTGTQKICIAYNPAKPMSVKRILSRFDIKIDKSPKETFSPDVQKELLLLEEQEGSVNFKFGVLYASPGQTTDDEMFSNENGSEAFENFISILGEHVPLQHWDKFNGGLDVKNNTTGTKSVYTTYEGHEIMFHVSTMLPFSKENKQQVERKRHVGNDIATIVFQETESIDDEPTFKPSMIRSHFTHIFALVTFNKQDKTHKLRVFSAESVPLFGPPLPSPPVFDDLDEFRDFLLVKLINGEKAAFNTPVFAYKRQRTLDMLIKNLQQELQPEVMKQNMMNKRSLSDVISEPSWNWRNKKEEARQSEFVKTGQLLKLKTIVKGDAPTSLATTSLLKREPWEPQVLLNDFPHDIFCGDAWGDKLLVATDAGTFVIEEGVSPRMMFDKSAAIKQLTVVEAHGLLLFRADKGKEGRIYVFRLSDFEGEEQTDHIRTRSDCKDHKLEKTRGCTLFAVSRPGGSHLRMVVAMGKKLSLFTWKHSAAWSAWCTVADTDTIEGFQFVKELPAGEVPSVMALVDGVGGDNEICVGHKHQFDLINERTGETKKLIHLDSQKVSFVSVLDIYEEDEPEVLLSYNHISKFAHLGNDQSSDFDIHWNGAPTGIACAFPYIIAFTHHSIEIRLVINGNLVHTMTFPKLRVISTKCDMYFTSANNDFLQPSPREPMKSFSPMASPTSTPPGLSPSSTGVRILKIPLLSLIGQMPERPGATPTTRVKSFISPLVNNCDSPEMTSRRPHEDNGLTLKVDCNISGSNGSVTVKPPPNRQHREYSDSGYEESDYSFESQDSLPVKPMQSPKLNGSAEARRKLFGCLKSPRQPRRAISPLASDSSAKGEFYSGSSPLNSPAMRKRIDSCHSDVFPPSPNWESKESRTGSLLSTDSDTSFHDYRPSRSSLVSNDSTSSNFNDRSQTEAEMRAELFGKHPKLERLKENSITMFNREIDDTGVQASSSKGLVRPFALSLSMDDDDIDLK
ncbi:GTPase-activating Rap/Ran-GAP domain-like protein 3 isoform X4 [Apostichopus japonicus]|uniref:GTPase-activating Rap/Ran-GAP domain-like protein 3 isoform X4 n=1 Tax=Stichopus japonicus TaxID=307972 RepID=UPI003AB25CD3